MSGETRTKFVVLHSRARDWRVVAAALALFVLVTYFVTWSPSHSFFTGL